MELLLLVAKKSIDRHFYTIRFKLSLFGTINLATLFEYCNSYFTLYIETSKCTSCVILKAKIVISKTAALKNPLKKAL